VRFEGVNRCVWVPIDVMEHDNFVGQMRVYDDQHAPQGLIETSADKQLKAAHKAMLNDGASVSTVHMPGLRPHTWILGRHTRHVKCVAASPGCRFVDLFKGERKWANPGRLVAATTGHVLNQDATTTAMPYHRTKCPKFFCTNTACLLDYKFKRQRLNNGSNRQRSALWHVWQQHHPTTKKPPLDFRQPVTLHLHPKLKMTHTVDGAIELEGLRTGGVTLSRAWQPSWYKKDNE
jgi:hypothetical protein